MVPEISSSGVQRVQPAAGSDRRARDGLPSYVHFGKGRLPLTSAMAVAASMTDMSFTDGKHRGKEFEVVRRQDRGYVAWLKTHQGDWSDPVYHLYVFYCEMRQYLD